MESDAERIRKVLEYAWSSGHGIRGSDMWHPGCSTCRMVAILEGS